MYQLRVETRLDQGLECYKKIITIQPFPPKGPLGRIVRLLNRVKLSPFDQPGPCCTRPNCIGAILDPRNLCDLLCFKDIGILFSYLAQIGYQVDTQVTKVLARADIQLPGFICTIRKITP
jgi:hypothetical protein